ncbi:8951_t:CDS:1, partial [Racocetra fulgida]
NYLITNYDTKDLMLQYLYILNSNQKFSTCFLDIANQKCLMDKKS